MKQKIKTLYANHLWLPPASLSVTVIVIVMLFAPIPWLLYAAIVTAQVMFAAWLALAILGFNLPRLIGCMIRAYREHRLEIKVDRQLDRMEEMEQRQFAVGPGAVSVGGDNNGSIKTNVRGEERRDAAPGR